MATGTKQIQDALAAGTDARMLCEMCTWDRFCIEAPSMTTQEIKTTLDKMQEDSKKADEEAGREPNILGSLMGTLMFAGKDTSAHICPVLANRLREQGGRQIVDTLKSLMLAWE